MPVRRPPRPCPASGYGNRRNIGLGAIKTPINAALLADKTKLEALLANIPLGRMGEPEDVAGVALFLASADAAYVTGSTYFVDGGLIRSYHEQ